MWIQIWLFLIYLFFPCCVMVLKDLCVFLCFQGFSDFVEEMLSHMAQVRREVMLLIELNEKLFMLLIWLR